MTHEEYLNQLEKKIRILNRVIDYKILAGKKYNAEAKEHKMLLQKIWEHKESAQQVPVRSSFFNKLFSAPLRA